MSDDFVRNDMYEYHIEKVRDSRDGSINIRELQGTLNNLASKGWRLRSTIVNEIGTTSNTTSYGGISHGTNATIDETILIFERRIRTASEIQELNREYERNERERIEREQKEKKLKEERERKEKELEHQQLLEKVDNLSDDISAEELTALFIKYPDKKVFLYNLIYSMGGTVSLVDIRNRFNSDKVDIIAIGNYVSSLVNEGKLVRDDVTKKYSVVKSV